VDANAHIAKTPAMTKNEATAYVEIKDM